VRLTARGRADRRSDGKLSFEEFKGMISSQDFAKQMTLVRPPLDHARSDCV